jgi:hypothetical protein
VFSSLAQRAANTVSTDNIFTFSEAFMASVTIAGGTQQSPGLNQLPRSQVLVTTLLNLQQAAGTIAAAAAAGINADTVTGATTIVSGAQSANTAVTISSIASTLFGIVVENMHSTTISNVGGPNNETIYSGIGGLVFSDYNSSDTIVAGGGTNKITFTEGSKNGLFAGDGYNTVNVNSTVSGSANTIVGTSSSSDTIIGSTVSGGAGIVYQSSSLASAFIDPGAHNATVIGAPNSNETVSVFGGGPAFTGSLTVISGNGYFQGGSAGHNVMASDTVGSTTMIGGGAGDVITSNGQDDVLYAGTGSETLQSAGSLGGVAFYVPSVSSSGATTLINMHINSGAGSNSVIGASSVVSENIVVNDFVSGTDKLVLHSSAYTEVVSGSGNSAVTTITSNGSTFVFNGVALVPRIDITIK